MERLRGVGETCRETERSRRNMDFNRNMWRDGEEKEKHVERQRGAGETCGETERSKRNM